MIHNTNCLLIISLILFAQVLNAKIKNSSALESSRNTNLPVSEFPPLDMTEKNWPAKCSSSEEQTPIDLPNPRSENVIQSKGEVIRILKTDYKTVKGRNFANQDNKKFGMDLSGQGSLYVQKNGIQYKYDLLNIHVHIHSEHTFRGKQGDLELHIVHLKDKEWLKAQGVTSDPDERNGALVLGTVWQASGNQTNPLIESLNWSSGENVEALDMTPWAMTARNFWHYEGSLTVPQCTEFVNWVLYDGVFQMSEAQYQAIKKHVFEVYPWGNSRNTKQLNQRKLYYVTLATPRGANLRQD